MRKQQALRVITSIAIGLIAIPNSIIAIRVPNAHVGRVDVTSQNSRRTSNDLPTQARFLLALLASHIPGGSVWIRQCNGQEPVFRQDPTILPLREALESITRADP